jgi:glyoxylase-like metal-dependent hydrolase (beta-lactamase superfamily II)
VRGHDASGKPYVLLVDPTQRERPTDYYFDLNRRTGLHAGDVTHCYVTHEHGDHQAGLAYFPNATWCAAPGVAEALRGSDLIDGARVQAVQGEFLPGVCPIGLPGHTFTLHGLALVCGGKKVVVAGDAIMTRDHYRHATTEFEKDAALAAETIRALKIIADVVIPGHDNLIVNWR